MSYKMDDPIPPPPPGDQDGQSAQGSISGPPPVQPAKKQSPQSSVDKFWKKFTTKYPGKVRSVLPSDIYAKKKAQSGTGRTASGQQAVKSYDQAAAECKHAVEKISHECRRVNHKYRDQHFDIEFDLKRNRRDCLDGLRSVSEDEKQCPGSVKRVTEIFEKPEFFIDEASASDVRQGYNGDCWFLSALCAISNEKNLINRICIARDERVGVYGFVFHRDGEWFHTVIDDKLYLTATDWWESSDQEKRIFEAVNRLDAEERYRKSCQTGSKALYFAQCREENETWLPLLEKAFAKAHGDYAAIDGGFTGEAIEDLTGGVTTELFTTDLLDTDQFWKEEIMKVNDKFLFSCATGTFDRWRDSDIASRDGARSGIIRMHAYSIMDAVEVKGERLLKVRNPWGTDEWKGPWSDGSEQWTGEWLQLLNHTFGDDGMFWISYKDLLRRYSQFERTRLFDKAWTITQQWTTINVPWSADYNDTKFTITITKRSPIVIVLSQLDDRYFRGMEGEYDFQLHFRLDKDGESDYIVRSHGNYSMRRSVSTDLELDPGTYSVLMKVTARRLEGYALPEAVIRDNVKFRQNKLIQIGLSYDLAHAKGDIVEDAEEQQYRLKIEEKQKAVDKAKMRKEIAAKKRKEWEFNKRAVAREKRHKKKKEKYQERKKAMKKGLERNLEGVQTEDAAASKESNATVSKLQEGKADEVVPQSAVIPLLPKEQSQATSGATANEDAKPHDGSREIADLTKTNDSIPDESDSLATKTASSIETQDEAKIKGTKSTVVISDQPDTATTSKIEADAATKAAAFERDLKAIPSVTVNGTEASPQEEKPAPTAISIAAPSAPPSAIGADDDYLYDSDASYQSSIDSVLDFPATPASPERDGTDPATPDGAAGAEEGAADDSNDDADAEFANDPWNAVCVVGLRVYSKDDKCCIKVVRPRAQEDDENVGLEVDDASKGVSGEKEDHPTAATDETTGGTTDGTKEDGKEKSAHVVQDI